MFCSTNDIYLTLFLIVNKLWTDGLWWIQVVVDDKALEKQLFAYNLNLKVSWNADIFLKLIWIVIAERQMRSNTFVESI